MSVLRVALLGATSARKAALHQALVRALEGAAKPVCVDNLPLLESTTGIAFDVRLLVGLGLHDTGPEAQAAELSIRQALAPSGQDYQVLYGTPAECLAQALAMIDCRTGGTPVRQTSAPASSSPGQKRAWVWNCDKCSDPQCEHRLLTGLLATRQAGGGLTGPFP